MIFLYWRYSWGRKWVSCWPACFRKVTWFESYLQQPRRTPDHTSRCKEPQDHPPSSANQLLTPGPVHRKPVKILVIKYPSNIICTSFCLGGFILQQEDGEIILGWVFIWPRLVVSEQYWEIKTSNHAKWFSFFSRSLAIAYCPYQQLCRSKSDWHGLVTLLR